MSRLYRYPCSNAYEPPFVLCLEEEELLCIQFALMTLNKGAAEAAGYDPDTVEELLLDVTEDYLNDDLEENLPA